MLMRTRHSNTTYALPYGAVVQDHGVQFAVFSRNATDMRLLLYNDVSDVEPNDVVVFDPTKDKLGDVWSVFVPGLTTGQLYHFQAIGPSNHERGLRFESDSRLIDPYAKALAGSFQQSNDGNVIPPKCVVVDDSFDWEGDRHLCRCLSETVIYELHVKGFTNHDSSGVVSPGTYLGIIEKIPYLVSLGVTAVELMPVHEFLVSRKDKSGCERANYWGYDPIAFFAPHQGYAHSQTPGTQVVEFKKMVKALHQAGIEVILDVVFNHTGEGNELGPVLSFKGLENSVYYMLEDDQRYYKNFSGCGNTINGNHPVVREMILHCLRYWVHNYHVDGFRFDLASILSRDRKGNLVPSPPLIEAIGQDPLLADTKIIAEAWDAAGAYQVGSFSDGRWAEWNGRYRDDVRRYWRGDLGMRGAMATRLAGSSDLYMPGGRSPCSSINFITSHDGFTLNDVVSYREKHNLANGEDNCDGEQQNFSENFGVEGPTDRPDIDRLRLRQIKNMIATLMLSQGVPMMVAGDEFRRSQRGNNNAYCQDNEVSWLDWDMVQQNAELVRFVSCLIEFRRVQPTVRRARFLTGTGESEGDWADVSWFDPSGQGVDWHTHEQPITCLLACPRDWEDLEGHGRDMMLMLNAGGEDRCFEVPDAARVKQWRRFVNTALPSPQDIYPLLDGPALPFCDGQVIPFKTMVVYVAEEDS